MVDGGARNDRQHARTTVDAFVRAVAADAATGPEYVLRVRDLSEGGLFLYTRVGHLYPFTVGDALRIALYDFDQTIDLRGVVVRVVETGSPEANLFPVGFGVRIVEIDSAHRSRLARLLERAQRGELIY